ncbi:hypothetical protein [Nocardia vermiculata]|uniref:Uncharacterized protein n=1 Tax=Nocardia vermiculata TaxID=257274 RepID=A0A846XQH9_9NOCA|nr:hypothetical protein [Nocardia vermiculata]NKY49303.1 hypothetical protein [Nocardia vermiculata]
MSQERRVTLVHEQGEFAETRAAEKAETERRNALAVRTVAGHSIDAADCTALLQMLGLDAESGQHSEAAPAGPVLAAD